MKAKLSSSTAPQALSFRQALLFWLKLGFISFGGPAGQIAVMHQELVEKRRWISERRFLHALNYCMLLPGPEAQQLATYIGWLMHRTWGGLVAGGLFILPSLFILMGLSWVYLAFGHVTWVAGVFYAIKPVVTAIVLQASYRIGSRALKNKVLWSLAVSSFLAISVLKIAFPAIILTAALVGYWGSRLAPNMFEVGAHSNKPAHSLGPALLDDADRPAHTHFKWSRTIIIAGIGVLLWAVPMAVLTLEFGWQHALTQMGWFFTKAALLTFGGAYAVLPYVFQGAVEQYHWLQAQQMIDGLALGETTPGPLIMVVTFVGYVAGWSQALFGAEQLAWAGAVAAIVVTYFTFLPSFLFILIGGPLVESTHGNLKLTAPLTAITAAVVGVILNLAVFFGWHVFWPQGFQGGMDWLAVCIFLGAAWVLLRGKIGVIVVIAASGVLGLLLVLVKFWLIRLGY